MALSSSQVVSEVLRMLKEAGKTIVHAGDSPSMYPLIDGFPFYFDFGKDAKTLNIGDKKFRVNTSGEFTLKSIVGYILLEALPNRKRIQEYDEKTDKNEKVAELFAKDRFGEAVKEKHFILHRFGKEIPVFPHYELQEGIQLSYNDKGLILRFEGLTEEQVKHMLSLPSVQNLKTQAEKPQPAPSAIDEERYKELDKEDDKMAAGE